MTPPPRSKPEPAPKVLFSPEVIWAAQQLPDPVRTSEFGWTVGSRSMPGRDRHVHTDATPDGKFTYASCDCPAGAKGPIPSNVATCGHVFKVLMLIATGELPPIPLPPDPAREAISVWLRYWLERQNEASFTTIDEMIMSGDADTWEHYVDQLADEVLRVGREATRRHREEQSK